MQCENCFRGSITLSEDGRSFEGELADGEMGAPYPLYFYGELDQPALSWGVWSGNECLRASEGSHRLRVIRGQDGFNCSKFNREYEISISNVDMDGAHNNSREEHTGFDIVSDQEVAPQVKMGNGLMSSKYGVAQKRNVRILLPFPIMGFKCPPSSQMTDAIVVSMEIFIKQISLLY